MKPLWKVKGFEQHITERTCSRVRFLVKKKEEHSDTDMYMPPLVHVRTLFSSFFSVSSLLSPLSSSFLYLSVCLRVMDVALVLCLVCVCVCEWWEREGRSKRPPCQDSKRPRVCGQHVRVFPVHTWTPHTPQHRPHTTRHTEAKRKEEEEKSSEKMREKLKEKKEEKMEEKIKEIKRK